MQKNKILLGATVSAVVIGGVLMGSTRAFAQESTSATNPMASLVQMIASKFGLNKDEVQAVFDQSREEMQKNRQEEYATRLSQLVTDGKITEAQKQLILSKHAQMQTARENELGAMKDQTQTERRASMEARRTELENWATQNGIDVQYLMQGNGKNSGGRGMQGFGGRHDTTTNSPSTTQ